MKKELERVGIRRLEKFFQPVWIEDVRELEQTIGASLPDSYVQFLLTCGLSIVDACFPSGVRNESIEVFYGKSTSDCYSLMGNLDTYVVSGRMSECLLPIGSDAGDNQICLGIKGEYRGRVYFWDHNYETIPGGPAAENNLFLIANSFDEFLSKLETSD